jgi:hypothetical protein
MGNKNYHTVGTASKPNHKTVYVEPTLLPLAHIYMTAHLHGLVETETTLLPLTHIYMTALLHGLVVVLR